MKKLFTMIFAASMTFAMTSAVEANESDSSEDDGIMAVGRSLAFQLRQNHLAQFHVLKASLEELMEDWRLRIGSFDSDDATEAVAIRAADVVESDTAKEIVSSEAVEALRASVRDISGQRVLPAKRGVSAVDRPVRSSTERILVADRMTRVEQLDATDIADSMIAARAARFREAARVGSFRRVRAAAPGTFNMDDVELRCEEQASTRPNIQLSNDQPMPLRSAVSTACRVQAQADAAAQANQDKQNGTASR